MLVQRICIHTHHDRSWPTTPPSELILVCGDSRVPLTGPELRGLTSEDQIVTVMCMSGTRYTAAQTGILVLDLFTNAGLDDETTHLLVEGADGYRVCTDVYATLDAVVACVRGRTSIGEEHGYGTRFIAPDIGGSRTMKGACAVGALALDPTAGPESLEDILKKP